MHKEIKIILFFFLFFSQFSCNSQYKIPSPPKREFRASWIVTVDNKDFPSRPGMSSDEQKLELTEMVEFHQQQGMNAIIFQVRPSADAFYQSKIEPWSEWISGTQGKAPEPYYDPLAYVIEECHRRNMELHAWFNPYRAIFSMYTSSISDNHVLHRHPEWFVEYAKKKYFNPGIPEVRKYTVDIIVDVLKRYDIDGIHFDDYFYPYRAGKEDFPDEDAFYKFRGEFNGKNDWRRNNISLLIKEVHEAIRQIKPYVKFGVSPLGVWRNKTEDARGSLTFSKQTAYEELGADVIHWLEKGWIDYIAPQLYWSIGHAQSDYRTLVNWWSRNNFGKHVYIGQAIFKIGNDKDANWHDPSELLDQIRINRSHQEITGSVFFRARFLMENNFKVSDSLKRSFYQYPALVPSMPWKDNLPPYPPNGLKIIKTKQRIILKWKAPEPAFDTETASYYVVYRFREEEIVDLNNPKHIVSIQKERIYQEKQDFTYLGKYKYVVTALDRLHNESKPALVHLIE